MNKAIYMGLHYQSKVWDQCWKKKKNITFIQFIKLIFQSLNWSKVKLNTWVIITHFITISTCLLQEKKSVVNSTSQHQLKEPLRAKFSFDCWLFSHSVSVSVIVNEVSSLLAKVFREIPNGDCFLNGPRYGLTPNNSQREMKGKAQPDMNIISFTDPENLQIKLDQSRYNLMQSNVTIH